MNKNMNLPAEYAVLSEEEMTYTQGGGVISTLLGLYSAGATIVGTGVLAVVLGASYIWGISASKDWLNKKSNREGNLFTVLGRAADAVGEDMSKSAANFVRDAVSSTMVVALAPLSAVLLIL